ncbi:MAG: hypothetical protein PSX81_05930 [bacterium]|nr:hypothetical protein [bacterium]
MEDAVHFEAEGLLKQYTAIEKKWEDAKVELKAHILNLLETDLPALYQLLYRIDIDEKKARLAFGEDSATIATNLVELILQRILQKAKSRVAYRQGK